MGKLSINIPLDWSLNSILYSFDEGISKADIVAAAIRHNKKAKVEGGYLSKKLKREYPDKEEKAFFAPELTPSGRRALLHVNVPEELYESAKVVAYHSRTSINKAIHCMIQRLYDSNAEVTPLPRARKTSIYSAARIAINFPVALIEEVEKQDSTRSFREVVVLAVEDYVRRQRNGRNCSSEGMGEE